MTSAKILIFIALGCGIILLMSFYEKGVGGSQNRGPLPAFCYGDYTSSTIVVYINDNGSVEVNGKVHYIGLIKSESIRLKETCKRVDVLISTPKNQPELFPGLLVTLVDEANDVIPEGDYTTVVTRK